MKWWHWLLIGVTVISGLILSICYDLSVNGNAVTVISGLWSAGATIGLGIIAIWQNKRYKLLADKFNEKMEEISVMPEVYISNCVSEPSFVIGSANSGMSGKSTKITVRVHILNFPVINFFRYGYSIKNDDDKEVYSFIEKDQGGVAERVTSLYSKQHFTYSFFLPNGYDGNMCRIEFRYRDMYGHLYSKKTDWILHLGSTAEKYVVAETPMQYKAERL